MINTQFSNEQIYQIYHEDYMNFALKPFLQTGIIVGKFISIKYLFPNLIEGQNLWEGNLDNPFINKYIIDKEKLGISVLQNGMYFPFYVVPIGETENYCVFEGRHRIESLKRLMIQGKCDPEFKVLCMVAPSIFSFTREKYVDIPVQNDLAYRLLFADEVFGIAQSKKRCDGLIINEYTSQYNAINAFDLLHAVEQYQYTLSHWFYYYDVKPSKIINDEKEFYNWINKPQG